MLAVNGLRNKSDGGMSNGDGVVLYIDCEAAFSAKRIEELMIFANEFEVATTGAVPFIDVKGQSERIKVQEIRSSADFSSLLDSLESKAIASRVCMVIVDSIAALVRHEFDSSSIFKRQNLLTNWAVTLKALAEKLDIPIIVTNQVTSSALPESDPYSARSPIAALGTGWYHSVNTRLTLQKCRPNDFEIPSHSSLAYMKHSVPDGCTVSADGFLRCLGISKSPISPVVSFPYFISRCGLCLVKRLHLGPTADLEANNEEYICEFEPANYWFNG